MVRVSGSGWMFFALQFAHVTLLLWAAVALLEAAGMRQTDSERLYMRLWQRGPI
jgi:hypothetical protein